MDASIEADFLEYARTEYPREAAAFVVVKAGRFRLVKAANVATDPGADVVTTPADWQRAEDTGEVVAFLHSHPDAGAAPSIHDQTASAASGIDWHICGLPGGRDGAAEWHHIPRSAPAPLVGRRFYHGINDCWSLVRDWHKLERGAELPDFFRDRFDYWWRNGESRFLENYAAAGFRIVGTGSGALSLVEVGDMMLFHIDSNIPNHCGVYVGDNHILHHLDGRLSSRDPLSSFYIERLTHVFRQGGSNA